MSAPSSAAAESAGVAGTISASLAEFAASLRLEAVPAPVRERAKHLMLDAVGIALASGTFEFARKALAGLRALGEGDSWVIGMGAQLAPRDAAIMNGILVHGLDYDDTYLPGSIHLAATAVPTALAAAARENASGRDLLAACIVGMETGARLSLAGRGNIHRAGFHPTSVCGAFSASLVAGKLMGLAPSQLAMAQGIALATAAGTVQPMQDGTWTKRLHPGWVSSAGITAASLAKAGFEAPAQAYEGRYGFYNVFLGQWAGEAVMQDVTDRLGRHWEFPRASIKLYPACHHVHAFANAALRLREEHHLQPGDIESVHARVASVAVPLVCEPAAEKCRPESSYIAQFSLQYALACSFARGRFGLRELEEPAYSDASLHALARKVTYEIDPNSGFPKTRTGEIVVRTKNGRELRHREEILPDEPAADAQIVTKFMENAQMAVSAARAARIRDLVLGIENEKDARRIAGDFGGVAA